MTKWPGEWVSKCRHEVQRSHLKGGLLDEWLCLFPTSSSFAESQNGKMRGTTPSDSDDEAEKDLRPRLKFEDNLHQRHVLDGLNNMRRNKHFCDVVLQVSLLQIFMKYQNLCLTHSICHFQVGKQEYFAHRVVLAAMSPYLMELFNSEQPTRKELEGAMVYELNGGFNKSALQVLIEFGYTARYVRTDMSTYIHRISASIFD